MKISCFSVTSVTNLTNLITKLIFKPSRKGDCVFFTQAAVLFFCFFNQKLTSTTKTDFVCLFHGNHFSEKKCG